MAVGDRERRRAERAGFERAQGGAAQLSLDSRTPLSTASTTFRPSARAPIRTNSAALVSSRPHRGPIAHARHRDRQLLIGEIHRPALRAPPQHRRMREVLSLVNDYSCQVRSLLPSARKRIEKFLRSWTEPGWWLGQAPCPVTTTLENIDDAVFKRWAQRLGPQSRIMTFAGS